MTNSHELLKTIPDDDRFTFEKKLRNCQQIQTFRDSFHMSTQILRLC